jgi:choline dehydrogenase
MQWAVGKALGGGSAINGLVYMRGERSDYDAWAALGCTGWGYDDIIPYFLKSERFHGPASQTHGSHGQLSVSPVLEPLPLGDCVIDAFTQAGIPLNEDYCNGNQSGVFRNYTTMQNGERCSTSRAFLEPARKRANLVVVTGALVERVVIEQGRATGVEYLYKGERRIANAAREVIVSAGTMLSPTILMRSGIGPAQHLRELGIAIACDLPGVGQNLREHNSISLAKLVNIPTLSSQLNPLGLVTNLLKYIFRRRGIMTTTAVQFMAGRLQVRSGSVAGWLGRAARPPRRAAGSCG